MDITTVAVFGLVFVVGCTFFAALRYLMRETMHDVMDERGVGARPLPDPKDKGDRP